MSACFSSGVVIETSSAGKTVRGVGRVAGLAVTACRAGSAPEVISIKIVANDADSADLWVVGRTVKAAWVAGSWVIHADAGDDESDSVSGDELSAPGIVGAHSAVGSTGGAGAIEVIVSIATCFAAGAVGAYLAGRNISAKGTGSIIITVVVVHA